MFNKNSGPNQDFFNKRTYFLAFLFLQLTYSQICLQFEGSSCTKCANGFQLIEKGCVSLSSINYTDNPMLIFQDIPGVQKVLYGVNPVIVSIQYGNGFNQEQKNIVNKFQVVKVRGDTLGNFYEVKTNDVKLQNSGNETANSSILLQVFSRNIQNITAQKGKQSVDNQFLSKLTKDNENIVNKEESFNLIRISKQSQQTLTKINKKQEQININKVSQYQSSGQSNLNIQLHQIKQAQQDNTTSESSPTKINESRAIKQENSLNLVKQSDSISTSNSKNNEFLSQLQQINMRLTEIGQAIDPSTLSTAKKINSSPLTTQLSLVQVTQTQQDLISPTKGTINIQLTQAGQRLSEIPQLLTLAKIKNSSLSKNSPSKQQEKIDISTNLAHLPSIIFPKLVLNGPSYLSNSNQIEEIKLIGGKQLIFNNWVKATRYELFNLTYIPQSLIQAKLKQSGNSSQDKNASYVFKCLSKLILYVPPNTYSSQDQKLYSEYFKNLINILDKQFKRSTLADKSTLCLDPPFDNSYKQLLSKYKSKIEGKPILAVYYEYCGFGKSFRIFFVQDSNFPEIIIYQASIVVDLFRMMPQQVFFSIYDKKSLNQQ